MESVEAFSFIGRQMLCGESQVLTNYLGRAAILRLSIDHMVRLVGSGETWMICTVFGRCGMIVDAPSATAPHASNLPVSLLELHPGVDEQVLPLQKQEGLESVYRL